MSFDVDSLLSDCALDLLDPRGMAYSVPDLLTFLDAGLNELITIKPAANTKTVDFKLSPGTTKQNTPGDCLVFGALVRNLGADGETPGPAITLVDPADLDLFEPAWHVTENSSGQIDHYTFDPLVPDVFYVYRRAPETDWYVEVQYAAEMPKCRLGGTVPLSRAYREPLRHYVISRAYSRTPEVPENAGLAVAHYSQFITLIGAKTQSEGVSNPNARKER